MLFKTHTLKEPLHNYIESIFHFKDFIPDHSIERVVPTGHLFIIFELDGFKRNTFDNETLEPNNTFTKVWISGMHKNYISISAHQKSEMFVIQFKPFGAHPFFHFPIQDLNEKVIPAEEIFGDEILKIREQILSKETSEEKFLIAETWLNSRFDKTKIPPSELLVALEKIQTESVANYTTIIESYPKTQKHFIDQFKKYIGLTPKYFQRILRFNEILQQIHKNEEIDWAQIAYQCEYSDQSHFIKEFKHFSGFNPQKFIKEDFHKEEPNFFPLDREG
jgi:AraC-like DNA-binding protein